MNFVFVSLQRINTDRESTSTSLAKELARQNHQVLYVNHPLDRRTLLKKERDPYTNEHIRKIKEGEPSLVKIGENLWELNPAKTLESINWIPNTTIFRLFNKLNNLRFGAEIREAVRQLQFGSFILINDKDIFRSFYLKEILKPSLYVYLDRDYTLGFDYWKRHGITLEPELMKKSDAIVCNSLDFTKNASKYNPRSFYIGNGGDLSLFNKNNAGPVPPELRDLPRPVIGYVGLLTAQRLDIELIRKTALNSRGSVVLIGAEDEIFSKSDLHNLKNVYFIEKKHTREIPSYINAFDVCINPQVINKITIGNFPLKIIEYLAMGKPVVAISTNTMREVFSEHCYLSEDHDGFIENIETALRENNTQLESERMEYAQNFSWENIVKRLTGIICSLN
ncbi:glycosyltransferase [Pararcticibacter amylolyticus]|uniref:Group 1 glycosyl transferase n=1 Tax=Pararcticibacter amylolyticus TaxID=2173175 RepID=A0A2U2PL91_9SPHI|nr:glycosyltransferase [Pararcticibacter amylolyticus]PWG82175.1 group 1 glycosyl transferase [Pararcticibacter amylolyticus]